MSLGILRKICLEKNEYEKFFTYLENDIAESESALSTIGGYLESVKSSLREVEKASEEAVQRMQVIKRAWETLPRRGEIPEIRMLLNSNFDSKGNLIFSWSPFFPNQAEINTCNNMIIHNLGRDGNTIKIDKVRLLSELVMSKKADSTISDTDHTKIMRGRNILWSLSLLQELLSEAFNNVIPTQIGAKISFSYDGKPTIKDEYQLLYEGHLNWISNFEARFQLKIGYLVYFSENEMTPQQIRDYTKNNFPREMSYAEANQSLKRIQQIIEYNESVWRRTQLIQIPPSEKPERVIPENRLMIKRTGKLPRLSPIAIRGIEGSNILEKSALRIAIEQRILENGIDWHFTAGDFIDYVQVGNRIDVVQVLDRIKKKGDIISVYKGVYTANINHADHVMTLEALLRDRGELFVSSHERAFCELGFEGNIFNCPPSFFTDGSLRNFYCLNIKSKLYQEPFPNFCKAALDSENPNAFIVATSLIGKGSDQLNHYIEVFERNGWQAELKSAQDYLGRFY